MIGTVVRYEPRGAARELLECRDAEVLIAGPAGTGKSLAMLFKLHASCLAVPGLRALLVRQTHASLTGTTLVTFERAVAQEAMSAGLVRWFGGSARQPAAYRYANGSEILVGGLDRPEKFLSSEFDRIAVDEATEITEMALETLISRLRGTAPTYKQIVCACNPSYPTHWIKLRSDRGAMVMLHSRHADNPAYVRADGGLTAAGQDYMAKLQALTGVRKLRLAEGRWAAAEGVIYELFDPGAHVIPRFDVPAGWPRWLSVDFGYTNPLVCQDWREDPDGRLYLVAELYRTRRLVEDHAKDILRMLADGPRPRAVVCDHDAEDRATLERHLGMSTVAAKKTVSDGIQAVQSRLKLAGDGRPRLFLVEGALVERDPDLVDAKRPTCTEEELPGYIWAIKPGGALKEEPHKENDHGCDALRYVVAERDLGVRPNIRWF
ncbi:phage terminase large subunit [Streptosporangiaceae bacterium NEAU-GS5]|nr:phage terminase large subunit [Streptosporangiaceae bacterium NEAU-GS5]